MENQVKPSLKHLFKNLIKNQYLSYFYSNELYTTK